MSERRSAGLAAEQLVADRLQDAGYVILDRNWHTRGGEIDIVALDGEVLAFIEVRARRSGSLVSPEESVGSTKLRSMLRAAELYLAAHPAHADRFWRVDLVAVTVDRAGLANDYRHYENVILD